MTVEQALKILTECTAKIPMVRDQHFAVVEALRTLEAASKKRAEPSLDV